jgi:hypothetical protein
MAPSAAPGVKVTQTPFETGRLAKEAHNSQSKVNVRSWWPEKKVFSGHCSNGFPKTAGFKEDERSWLPA